MKSLIDNSSEFLLKLSSPVSTSSYSDSQLFLLHDDDKCFTRIQSFCGNVYAMTQYLSVGYRREIRVTEMGIYLEPKTASTR